LTIQGIIMIMKIIVITQINCQEIIIGEVIVALADGVVTIDLTEETTGIIEDIIEVVIIHTGEIITMDMTIQDMEDIKTLKEYVITKPILIVESIGDITQICHDNINKFIKN